MRAKGKDPDLIAAKRLSGGRKRPQAGEYDPTKVARQNSGSSTTSTTSTSTATSPSEREVAPGVQRQVIQRQQPKKNSRAGRKQ
jgi:YidC/Oxa1 family membrane protein insertase